MNNQVFEIVVFKIKKDKLQEFLQNQPKMYQQLKTYKGFKSIITHQSIENPEIFVDYCLWETKEDAKNAAKDVMNDPKLSSLFNLIENVLSFEHYKQINS